jgi:LAO/AO transport system kinase
MERRPPVSQLHEGLLRQDPAVLGKAITLAESRHPADMLLAAELLARLEGPDRPSLRIGISGPPGVGKSTFIDRFGTMLCRAGHRVAVLAVDPSSSLSGGSILGDKTRMAHLAAEANAFIRPSPSSGVLGGLGRRSRESILLCEEAGFDILLVETVGVGQSEAQIRDLCDLFLLLLLPGAGDDLQGIKRGIMELADLLAVNKCEGENRERALRTQADTQAALHMTQGGADAMDRVHLISALSGEGLEGLWKWIREREATDLSTGRKASRRLEQDGRWFQHELKERLLEELMAREGLSSLLLELQADVLAGRRKAEEAVHAVLEGWRQSGSNFPWTGQSFPKP